MKNFVFSTTAYDNEAQQHGAAKVLVEFRKKTMVEGYTHPRNMEFTNFSGNYLKIKHGNLRSILTCKRTFVNDQEVCIYVALRMVARGGADYDKFKMSTKSERERDSFTGRNNIDWNEYEERVRQLLYNPTSRNDNPELTLNETSFISSPLNINHTLFEVTIFETKEWIDSVCKVDFTDFSNAATQINNFIINHLYASDQWYVITFKNHEIHAYKKGDNWILANIIDKNQNGESLNPNVKRDVPTDFQRGYPYTFLEDQDEWRLMEQDSKSNMVLSSQQVKLVSSDIKYPLFLTGRAGSGKSTMLQYLFAEVILRYFTNHKTRKSELKMPVYLSYSSNLINDAKKLCRTLFEKNNVYKKELEKMNVCYKNDIQPVLDQMFYVFKELLFDCIERKKPGLVSRQFPKDKYVSFPVFYKMWEQKFGKIKNAAKDYGPSISWHVIRTYIKGWDGEAYMTSEDYVQIGEKNQSVTPKTFKAIYDNVWENWYSKLEGVWDDQDLVVYCLKEECVDERFSAIFCDESQDFTRVEIDFILNSSSFAHRFIHNIDDINKLPFVFAGDEFQTLNPTGFSWELLRGYFTNRLCSLVGLVPQKGMIPDEEVLSENFRSTHNVVKLANRIQLLRASRFDEYSIPQKSHFSQEGNSVYCISPNDKFVLEKLKEKGVVLIVPANDGEPVKRYIEKTPLKELVSFDNEDVPEGITILNPTQAKGLEYPNVAIYGFTTDNSPEFQIDNLIDWFDNREDNTERDIELKYQISNAYVAVTRASSNLYIIDDVNRNSFWAFAFNQAKDKQLDEDVSKLQSLMLETLSPGRRSVWTERELGWIEYVEDIDISDENLNYLRSQEHKNDLENRAESLHDAKLMLQAASLHKSTGNKEDEARCRAKAAMYDDAFAQAAEWFEKAKMYDEAVDSYWLELNKKQESTIVDKIRSLHDHSHNKKVNFCDNIVAPSFRDIKIVLDDITTFLQINSNEQGCERTWEYVISLMIRNIKGNDGVKDISLIANSCLKLAKYNISIDLSILAEKAYKNGEYKGALDVWDSMGKKDMSSEYCNAKIKVENYPETIEYYEGTKDSKWYKNLLVEVHKHPNVSLDDKQKSIVCKAIRLSEDNKDDFAKYLPFMLRSANSITLTNQIIDEAISRGIVLNKDVLVSIAELRFSNLKGWKRPLTDYIDSEVAPLFDAIVAVKQMRDPSIQNNMLTEIRNKPRKDVKDYCAKWNRFSRKKASRFVFVELGKLFEHSGTFVNACIYYEWAITQTDEDELKRDLDERWIACKERQAENDDNEEYRIDAKEKRRVLQIGDKKLPSESEISDNGWEKMFSEYIKISNEVREKTVTNQYNPSLGPNVMDIPIKKSTIQKENNIYSSRHEISYGEYTIVYLPLEKNVLIKSKDDSIRIKQGVFPEHPDFKLINNRLYLMNEATPFSIKVQNGVLGISIMETKNDTGISILFDICEKESDVKKNH